MLDPLSPKLQQPSSTCVGRLICSFYCFWVWEAGLGHFASLHRLTRHEAKRPSLLRVNRRMSSCFASSPFSGKSTVPAPHQGIVTVVFSKPAAFVPCRLAFSTMFGHLVPHSGARSVIMSRNLLFHMLSIQISEMLASGLSRSLPTHGCGTHTHKTHLLLGGLQGPGS